MPTRLTPQVFFTITAIICFIIALLIATVVIKDGNYDAWLAGGLAAFATAHLPFR